MSRILWLAHRDISDPRSGGAERSIYELTTRLADLGHTVSIWTTQPRGAPNRVIDSNVEIIRVPTYLGSHAALPLYLLRRSSNVDLAVDDLGHVVPWPSSAWIFPRGITYFRHLHRRTLWGQVPRLVGGALGALEHTYRVLYSERQFVTESLAAKSDLEHLGIPRSRVHRIPPGVSHSIFRPRARSVCPRMFYFSGLRRSKRPELALRLLHAVRRNGENAELVMVGDGPLRSQLVDVAESLELANVVRFTGRLSQHEVAALLGTAWLHVLPSPAEGWGFTALEASAAGVPTVGFRVPGVEDAVGGGSGILAPEGDFDRFVSSALEILRGDRAGWEHSCREWAHRFTWESSARAWSDLAISLS